MNTSGQGSIGDILESRSIIGFQLDATHLQLVLQRLAQGHDALAAETVQNGTRMRALEQAVQSIAGRLASIEGALQHVGGADELRALKNHIADVTRAFDTLSSQTVPDLRRRSDEATQAAVGAERAVQTLQSQQLPAVDRALKEMSDQMNMNLRSIADEVNKSRQVHDEQRSRSAAQQQQQQQQVTNAMQELLGRLEQLERQLSAQQNANGSTLTLQQLVQQQQAAIEEMDRRMDSNFGLVERSSAGFKDELNKLRSEVANLGSNVNTLDHEFNSRLNRVKEDADSKLQALLQHLADVQHNTQVLKDTVVDVGQRMSSARSTSISPQLMSQFGLATNTPATTAPASALRGLR